MSIEVSSDDERSSFIHEKGKHSFLSPYDRQPPVSTTKIFFIIFNGVFGAGILALPFAIHMGGPISFVILSYVCLAEPYAALSFKKCIVALKSKGESVYSYQAIASSIWGPTGKIVVSLIWRFGLIGVLINFLILSGQVFNLLVGYGETISTLIAGSLVLVMIIMLPNLSQISWLSLWGIISALICTGIVIIDSNEVIIDPTSMHPANIMHRAFCPVLHLQQFVLVFTMISPSMGFHPMMPTIYSSMKKKHDWNWVVYVVYGAILYLKMLFMIMSYNSNHQLGLIDMIMKHKILQIIATVGIISDQIVPFPLVVQSLRLEAKTWFVSCYLREPKTTLNHCDRRTFRIIFAITLVVITTVIAIFLPYLAFSQALVGSFSIIIAQVIPCLYRLLLCDNSKVHRICLWTVISIGSVIAIICAAAAFTLIMEGQLSFHRCALPYQLEEVDDLIKSP